MLQFLFFLHLLGAALSVTTPVRPCKGTTLDMYESVLVTTPKGACTDLPCHLISGSDVSANIVFLARDEVDSITLKCNATTMGVTIDYPVPDAEKGCDLITNTFCPIEADTRTELQLQINVNKAFPKVNVDLVFYLLDHNNHMISCFEVPAKVV